MRTTTNALRRFDAATLPAVDPEAVARAAIEMAAEVCKEGRERIGGTHAFFAVTERLERIRAISPADAVARAKAAK